MRLLDLTHDIDGFVFPGNPECKPDGPHNLVGGNNPEFVYDLTVCTQSGTHVQGPHYFLKDGAKLDEIPLERWCGRAIIIDIPKRGIDTTADELRSLIKPEEIRDSILILRTGHMEELLESQQLLPEHRPGLSLDAAQFLIDCGVSMIGIDSVGVESRVTKNYDVNVLLCKAGVLLLEGLVNLSQINVREFQLHAFPLKIRGVEGQRGDSS